MKRIALISLLLISGCAPKPDYLGLAMKEIECEDQGKTPRLVNNFGWMRVECN